MYIYIHTYTDVMYMLVHMYLIMTIGCQKGRG